MRHKMISRRAVLAAGSGLALWSMSGLAAPLRAAAPLRIGVGIDPVYTGFYLAQHEGLFAAEGLEVDLQLFADGGESMNALVADQLDVSGASEPTSFLRMLRAPIRPLAVAYEGKSYIKLVMRPELTAPEQIKTFGVIPGTVSQYCVGLLAKTLQIDPAQLQTVNSGPPELPALLARGDIDGFFAWEPWPSNAVAEGGKIAMSSVDVGYRDTIWINASATILAAQPQDLQAMLRALYKASAIAQADPERAAVAVKAVTKLPRETTLRLLADMTLGVRDFTEQDFASYDQIARFLAEQKVTPAIIDYKPMMQRGFFQPTS